MCEVILILFLLLSFYLEKTKYEILVWMHYTHLFLIGCFTSYFVFSIPVRPHSPGVVHYHLLLRRETRITRVAPFPFRIGIWDLFVHRDRNPIHPQPLRSCGPLQV